MASQKLYFSLPLQTYERPRLNQIYTKLTALSGHLRYGFYFVSLTGLSLPTFDYQQLNRIVF